MNATTDLAKRSLAMLRSPDTWPHFPVLPMTRGDDCGLAFAVWGVRLIVFHMNMLDSRRGPLIGALSTGSTVEQAAHEFGVEFERYNKWEEMIGDGWTVD